MKELQKTFEGTGEVNGFSFRQMECNDKAYLYEVKCGNQYHYEVFRRKINRQYGNVSYPKAESFGKWAWTYTNADTARNKYASLSA